MRVFFEHDELESSSLESIGKELVCLFQEGIPLPAQVSGAFLLID